MKNLNYVPIDISSPIISNKNDMVEKQVILYKDTITPTYTEQLPAPDLNIIYIPIELQAQLDEIKSLQDNWDGYGAKALSEKSLTNISELLVFINRTWIQKLQKDNITPSSYGTIVMDWYNERGENLSLEIGKDEVGYFAELPLMNNPIENNIVFNALIIAQKITPILETLYQSN
jgi:hypothetical protein